MCSSVEKKLPLGILRTPAIKFSSVLKTSFGDIWRALTPCVEFTLYSLICLEVKYISHPSPLRSADCVINLRVVEEKSGIAEHCAQI